MTVLSWSRVLLVVLLVACQSATQPTSQAPTGTENSTGLPAASSTPGSETPAVTEPGATTGPIGPDESFGPIETLPQPPSDSPLPEPSMTNPDDIAIALLDPNRASDGVISLVTQMGIEIDAADGSVLRPGSDNGVGMLVLTEGEVRGLIRMTVEDSQAVSGGASAGVQLADFYDALQPSLPAGYTLEDLVADYARAYSEHPDALVPRVMFGLPIDASLPLTRLQAWLITVDGFLGRDTAIVAHHGIYAALASGTLGVARSYLPPLRSQIAGMSDEEWAYLVARLSTLAFAIPFGAEMPSSVQEGEAGLGTPATITGGVQPPPPVTFPATGRVLLAPNPSPAGISIEWNSEDEATLAAHGSLSGDLRTPSLTDASGQVSITYTPKAEESQGQGELVTEVGSLFGEATASDLISHAYLIDSAGSAAAISRSVVTGQLSPSTAALARYFRRLGYRVRFDPSPVFPIRWHAANTYRLNIRNKFDVTIQESGGGGPQLMRVHRTGRNEAQGVIHQAADGTYRGALIAWVFSDLDGVFFMGECHDHTDALQWLYVVGHPVAGESQLPPFINSSGTYAMADLMLYFYPASPPGGNELGPCQGTMDFLNGGPDGRPNGKFLPFNDSRWTAAINTVNWQDGIGLNVFLPNSGVLDYTDNRQIQPQVDVFSQWNVVVTKR